jgi:hypothetical protein
MNKLNKLFIVIPALIVFILSGCGKYEDGPGISLRTKNGRLEGEWKVTSLKYEWTSPSDPLDNESYNFNGTTLTMSYNEPIYDPITFEIIDYQLVNVSVPYSESFEFNTKENTCLQSTTEDGETTTYTQLWSWKDGASSKEILFLENYGGMIVKKLSNKELVLFQEYKENGTTAMIEYKMEKSN